MGVRVGVGVVLFQNSRILLGQRRASHGSGCWSLPGGHLEFKESPEDCAKREVFEETGILIDSSFRGPWVSDLIEDKHYVTLFMIAKSWHGTPINKEPEKCGGWQWCDTTSLPTPLFKPIDSLLKGYSWKELVLSLGV